VLSTPGISRAQEPPSAPIVALGIEPTTEAPQSDETVPECLASVDETDRPPEVGRAEIPPDAYVMPSTGLVFTLPDYPEPEHECLPPPPARPPAPDIFGLSAVPVGAKALPADWATVRSASLEGLAGPWNELLGQANKLTNGNPLSMVNRWVNWHVRYRDDQGPDKWSSAIDTLTRGSGDCEDFAIAKMALLEALGVPSGDMYLVLVRERSGNRDHAILAVRRENIMFILDNRTDVVQQSEQVADYFPTLSYSGAFAWTYGYRMSTASSR